MIAKRLADPYTPDKRTLIKVKHQRTADCVVAGYRIHKDGKGVGSLLLGLYDDDGRLHHVGVAASFTVKRRAELLDELEPLTARRARGPPVARLGGVDDHGARTSSGCPAGGSRWNAGKDLSWVPLRIERVAEVTFGQLQEGRFRHGSTFLALAARPHARELHLRPARGRRARCRSTTSSPAEGRRPGGDGQPGADATVDAVGVPLIHHRRSSNPSSAPLIFTVIVHVPAAPWGCPTTRQLARRTRR